MPFVPKPLGEEVFAFDNKAGFRQPVEPVAQHRLGAVSGVCAALVAMWIRRCYECAGDVTQLAQIGSKLQFEIAQSAGHMGAKSVQDLATRMFDQQRLKSLANDMVLVDDADAWNDLLDEFIAVPAMYWCVLLPALQGGSAAEGHVVGIKTGGPNASGFWTLDPNAGLFRSSVANSDEFLGNRLCFSLRYPEYPNLHWYRCALA